MKGSRILNSEIRKINGQDEEEKRIKKEKIEAKSMTDKFTEAINVNTISGK